MFVKDLKAPGCQETCKNFVLKFLFSLPNLLSKVVAALILTSKGN